MTSHGCSPTNSRLLLALNGAEERLQLVLGRVEDGDCALLCAQQWVVPGRGMQFLAPMIKDTLARLDLAPSDLSGIACVRGPGSFTGLRLVMATALGLATSLTIPMAGIDYLELLARSAAAQLRETTLSGHTLFVLTHSRRNQVYLQRFSMQHGSQSTCLTPLAPPTDASLEDAARTVAQAHAPLVLGSGLRRNADFFAGSLGTASVLPPELDNPTGDTLLAFAATLDYSHEPIAPIYLRPSDAEENLDAIAAKRGLDPADARKRLDDILSS